MRLVVRRDVCVGHGRCHAEAPELFDLDEMGYCQQGELEVPPELGAAARRGAGSCPERAIELITED